MANVRKAPKEYLYKAPDCFRVHPDYRDEYDNKPEADEMKSVYPELAEWPNDAVCLSWHDFIRDVHFGGCLDDSKRREEFLAYLYAVIELSKVGFSPGMISLDGLGEWWAKYDSLHA